jgi:hypothetical protein
MQFNFEVTGLDQVLQNLQAYGDKTVKAVPAALYQEAEGIIADSKANFVPVDLGTLRASGFVEPPDTTGSKASVTLGFGGPSAPYALVVHENPRAGKTGGVSPSGKPYKHWAATGGWKYLETPFLNWTKDGLSKIAERIRGMVR